MKSSSSRQAGTTGLRQTAKLAVRTPPSAAGDAAAIIDAPLLFESGFNVWCDWTVAVIADREVRIGRIMARDGISRESAANRIDCQPPEKFYIKRCDYIIYNNGTERADLQADLIWQMIRWV